MIRVIVKHPGCHAEVIEIDGEPESVERLIGGPIDPLFTVIMPGEGTLSMFAHAQPPATAIPNILHPGDRTLVVLGTVVWLEGDDNGHPRPIRATGEPHLLAFIAGLAPLGDQPDLAS